MWVILAWPQQVVKRGKEPVTLTLFFAYEKELLRTYFTGLPWWWFSGQDCIPNEDGVWSLVRELDPTCCN